MKRACRVVARQALGIKREVNDYVLFVVGMLLGVLFQEFLLNVAGHELIGAELHRER